MEGDEYLCPWTVYITSKKVKSLLFLSSNDCFIKESSFSICLGVDGFNRVLLLS